MVRQFFRQGLFLETYDLGCPPPLPGCNRHHQDYEPFLVGNPELNLHLPRLHPGARGVDPTYDSLERIRKDIHEIPECMKVKQFFNMIFNTKLVNSKRTPTFPWSIPQASPNPQMKGIPS